VSAVGSGLAGGAAAAGAGAGDVVAACVAGDPARALVLGIKVQPMAADNTIWPHTRTLERIITDTFNAELRRDDFAVTE
jgi:hypothetical protein